MKPLKLSHNPKKPEDNLGLIFRTKLVKWKYIPKYTFVLVEKYNAQMREFTVYSYHDNLRYAVPLLDFNRYFYYVNPQPILTKDL